MRKTFSVLIIISIILITFTGCDVIKKFGFGKGGDELAPVSSIVINEEEAKKLTDKIPINLHFSNDDNTKLRVLIRYIPLSEARKSPEGLASIIVKELIAGPDKKSGLKSTIPQGTQLRSPVKIEAGIATVDLSREFVDKHQGGKAAEQISIFSIVNSLTEMKDIQKVRFTINGAVQKEFKGNFKFDAAFPRSEALMSKEPALISPIEDKKDQNTKSGSLPAGTGDAKETSGEITEEELIETGADIAEEEEILE